jgi:hypothetical protein
VFILDELALRRVVDAGRYAFLLVRDLPGERWALWSTAELVLAAKVRVSRRLAATTVTDKGKVLIDLGGAAAITPEPAGGAVGPGQARRSDRRPVGRRGALAVAGGRPADRRSGVVMLWTLDEARATVATSATAILDHAQCDLDTRSYLVWGAGGMEGLSPADEVLSRRHRWVLDALIELGYAWVAVEELKGLCSAAGIDDADGDADVDEPPGWGERWPFAA